MLISDCKEIIFESLLEEINRQQVNLVSGFFFLFCFFVFDCTGLAFSNSIISLRS